MTHLLIALTLIRYKNGLIYVLQHLLHPQPLLFISITLYNTLFRHIRI